jgi:Flp pilus assembly protein TadD
VLASRRGPDRLPTPAVCLHRFLSSSTANIENAWSRAVTFCCTRLGVGQAETVLRDYSTQYKSSPYAAAVSLATAAFNSGQIESAVRWFAKGVCVEPGRFEATHNLGLAIPNSQNLAQLPSRLRSLEWATTLCPKNDRIKADHLQEHYRSGNLLAGQELLELGERSSDPLVLSSASLVAIEMQKSGLARHLTAKAVALHPNEFIAFSKKAVVALSAGDIVSAEADLRRSLGIQPQALEPMINIGRVLELKGEMRAALRTYEDALSRRPDLAEPRLNAAVLQLGLGNYSTGWDWYEARWNADAVITYGREKMSDRLVTTKPVFNPDRRDRVLLWAEQGLGDELMFASMFGNVVADADHVIAQADPRLITLFKRSFPSVEFHKRIRPVDESLYDSQIPIGSLGRLYRRDLASFASVVHPYLQADAALAGKFRRQMNPDRQIIGISWSTSNPDNGRHRSVDLARLCAVFVGKPIQLVNLQYNCDLAAINAVEESLGVEITRLPDVDNFAEIDKLAAVVSSCDLVISIGNATAHLAAALGRPTWVLTPAAGSWRWMFEGATTPWYPSVRVFRQKRSGHWGDVFDELSSHLHKFVKLTSCSAPIR